MIQAAALRGLQPGSPEFEEHLADRAGLPLADVRLALHDDSAAADPIAIAATLQKLQQALGAVL